MELSELWRRVKHNRSPQEDDEHDLQHQVNVAHRDWVTAQQLFQSVSDPVLVDQAIHSVNEAEQRYSHLLRRLREQQARAGRG